MKSELISLKKYQELTAQSQFTGMTIYHRRHWLETLAHAFDAVIVVARTVDHSGRDVALTPFVAKRKGPFHLLGSPLSGTHTEFAGPIFARGVRPEERAEILISQHLLVTRRAEYVEWGCSGREEAEPLGAVLEHLGYVYVARPTTVIDLSGGHEVVWTRFESRARNMVRKSEKAGIVSRTLSPNEEWTAEYYAMLSETFARQGRAVPHPYSFYKALAPIVQNGDARVVAASYGGKMVSGAIFLLDGRRMLLLSAASKLEAMKVAGSSSVQWHAIREAIASGIEEYDMGGLGVPSIDTFKRSFGGRDHVHHRWVYKSRLFRTMEPLARWAIERGWLQLGGR